MAQWKKKEYDLGDCVEYRKKRRVRRGMVVKKKRIRGGFTYIISDEEGGLVGPVFMAEINHCYRSLGDSNVARR